MKKLYISIFFSCLVAAGFAQSDFVNLKKRANYCNLSAGGKTCDKVVNKIEDAIDQYIKLAGLKNSEQGIMIPRYEKRKGFCSLFRLKSENGTIFYDFSTGGGYLTCSEYCDNAYSYFGEEGILFKVTSAELISLFEDFDYGTYRAKVKIKKVMQKTIDDDGKVSIKRRELELNFLYEIDPDDLDDVKIVKITTAGPTSYYVRRDQFISGYGFYNSSQYNATANTFFSDNVNYQFKDNNSLWGGGIQWRSTLTYRSGKFDKKNELKRKLTWLLGLEYGFGSVGLDIGSYQYEQPITEPESYLRIVKAEGIEEQVDYSSIRFSIGGGYMILDKEKLNLFLDLKFIPSYQITSESKFNFNLINYDGIIDEVNLRFSDLANLIPDDVDVLLREYNIGSYMNEQVDSEQESNLFFTIALAPTLQYEITDGLGIELTVRYEYGLGGPIGVMGDNDDPILFNYRPNNQVPSLLADNFQALDYSGLGASLGVYYQFSSERRKDK